MDKPFGWSIDLDRLAPETEEGYGYPLTDAALYRRVLLSLASTLSAAVRRVARSVDAAAISEVVDLSDAMEHLMRAHQRADPFAEMGLHLTRQAIDALMKWRRVGLTLSDTLEQIAAHGIIDALIGVSDCHESKLPEFWTPLFQARRMLESIGPPVSQWIHADPFESEGFYTITVQEGSTIDGNDGSEFSMH